MASHCRIIQFFKCSTNSHDQWPPLSSWNNVSNDNHLWLQVKSRWKSWMISRATVSTSAKNFTPSPHCYADSSASRWKCRTEHRMTTVSNRKLLLNCRIAGAPLRIKSSRFNCVWTRCHKCTFGWCLLRCSHDVVRNLTTGPLVCSSLWSIAATDKSVSIHTTAYAAFSTPKFFCWIKSWNGGY